MTLANFSAMSYKEHTVPNSRIFGGADTQSYSSLLVLPDAFRSPIAFGVGVSVRVGAISEG